MWPNYFPEQCPPCDASQENLDVYRLVSNNPPTKTDFLPTIIEFPHREFDIKVLCNACGVSVFKKEEDLKTKQNRYKNLKNKLIIKGKISERDGYVKETGEPSHVTWWLQTDSPHMTFMS